MEMVRFEEAVDRCSGVLPGDLIVEILQRLPVKSLLRFESVSKPWQFLILNPKFIGKHLTQMKKKKVNYLHCYKHVPDCPNVGPSKWPVYCPPSHNEESASLISNGDDGNFVSTSLVSHCPINFDTERVWIVGCSNGLVCIKSCYRSRNVGVIFYRDREFGIWNPATRKFKLLPSPQLDLVVPNLCHTIAGFSYISSTSTYKLVQISVFKKSADDQANDVRFGARVEVLNMGADSWTEILCDGQDETFREHKDCVVGTNMMGDALDEYVHNKPLVINGCLHWLGMLQHGGVTLVSFNLDNEVFTQVAVPYPFDYVRANRISTRHKLAVFEDNLAMFVSPDSILDGNEDNEKYFEVWIYEGTSQSWTKRFTFGPLPKDEHPVGFWEDREIIIRNESSFFSGYKAYLYNPNNKEKKNSPCRENRCNLAFEPFIETLVEI